MTDTRVRPLQVDDHVKFAGDRRWWAVVAGDERYTILVRQAEFLGRGNYTYTIIDRDRDLRGPCNLIGQGWEFSTDTLYDDAAALLRALQRHDEVARMLADAPVGTSIEWTEPSVEVSYRNNVPVRIEEVRSAP